MLQSNDQLTLMFNCGRCGVPVKNNPFLQVTDFVLIDATDQSKTPKNNMIILHNKDQLNVQLSVKIIHFCM
jgi:hypothetical protein